MAQWWGLQPLLQPALGPPCALHPMPHAPPQRSALLQGWQSFPWPTL